MAPFTDPETEAQAGNLPGYRGSASASFYLISEIISSRKLSSPHSRKGGFWSLAQCPPNPRPYLMLPSIQAHSILNGRTLKAGVRVPQALSPLGHVCSWSLLGCWSEGRRQGREAGSPSWGPRPGHRCRPSHCSLWMCHLTKCSGPDPKMFCKAPNEKTEDEGGGTT